MGGSLRMLKGPKEMGAVPIAVYELMQALDVEGVLCCLFCLEAFQQFSVTAPAPCAHQVFSFSEKMPVRVGMLV